MSGPKHFLLFRCRKMHAAVAKCTFGSANVQNTSAPKHFLLFRCRTNARRCGDPFMTLFDRFGPQEEQKGSPELPAGPNCTVKLDLVGSMKAWVKEEQKGSVDLVGSMKAW